MTSIAPDKYPGTENQITNHEMTEDEKRITDLEERIEALEEEKKQRNLWAAFILGGLFPGSGWLYIGEPWYWFFLVNFAQFVLVNISDFALKDLSFFGIIAIILLFGYLCYSDAVKINSGEKEFSGVSRAFIPLLIIQVIANIFIFLATISKY
jgi:hypothetical protein